MAKSRAVNSPQRSRLFASPTLESLQVVEGAENTMSVTYKKVLAGDRSHVWVIPKVDSPSLLPLDIWSRPNLADTFPTKVETAATTGSDTPPLSPAPRVFLRFVLCPQASSCGDGNQEGESRCNHRLGLFLEHFGLTEEGLATSRPVLLTGWDPHAASQPPGPRTKPKEGREKKPGIPAKPLSYSPALLLCLVLTAPLCCGAFSVALLHSASHRQARPDLARYLDNHLGPVSLPPSPLKT